MIHNQKKKSKAKVILFAILAVYVVCVLFLFFGMMFTALAETFIPQNLGWLYFGFIAILCLGFNFIGSIFTVYGQLFDAQDNELLFSLPIPSWMIMASRLFSILCINILMSLLILLPGYVIYAMYAPISFINVVYFILSVILLPCLSTTISCLFGWLVGLLVSKLRRKNLATTVLLLASFFAYFYFFSNIQNYITSIVASGEAIAIALRQYLPPVYYYGTALADGSLVNFLLFFLWCAVPFALIYTILSKSFVKIATTKKAVRKVKYEHRTLSATSARTALLKKELTRFFSLPMYIFNSGMGSILLLLLTGAILLRGEAVLQIFSVSPALMQIIPVFMCLVISFCAVMTLSSACALSLEGNSFWILRAHPIAYRDVMFAKIFTNLIISYPAIIIAAAAGWFRFDMSPAEGASLLLVPLLLQTASAQFGFIANLHYPRFNWVNETIVIKQSGSTVLAMLFGLGLMFLPVLLYVLLFRHFVTMSAFIAICAGLYVLVNIFLQAYLRTKGARLYEALQ
jgi:ABC-2 type transport system permease protein